MCLHARTRKSNKLTALGLFALALANVAHYLMQRTFHLGEEIVDPASGFLMGIAIATLLLGVRAQARAGRTGHRE